MIETFVRRPIGTALLALGIVLAGALAFFELPVSPLPQVDYPTIAVTATLPGGSPEVMASTVATPLERTLGSLPGVTELTSESTTGSTRVIMQFDLSRNIDDAAREVQGAINAARANLPTSLPSTPTYRKINPADSPIMILSMVSTVYSPAQVFDVASTVIAQRLAQVEGIGEVRVGGGALPAVRVTYHPSAIEAAGTTPALLRTAIASASAYGPKGVVEDGATAWTVDATQPARTAAGYRGLVIRANGPQLLRLGDVATVTDSVQDTRQTGYYNATPSIQLILTRQPGANIIATTARINALLPRLRAGLPGGVSLEVASERTATIKSSLHEVELALLLSIALVVGVVFLFLQSPRAALVPSVAVPLSLLGTFTVMWLLGFSLNNLSLMALAVAAGFVVDDAIVVLENVSRHLEEGEAPFTAAIRGGREVAFTVVSMSISLVAVFIPVLFMGGIVGRLFREFAVTLSASVLVSMVVSLTVTPMLCAYVLRQGHRPGEEPRLAEVPAWKRPFVWLGRHMDQGFERFTEDYGRTLDWTLKYWWLTLLALFATIALNVWLFTLIPKGFFPQQDTGLIVGGVRTDQSASFADTKVKLESLMKIVGADPAVAGVVGFNGDGTRIFVQLKPLEDRPGHVSADAIISRLRPKTAGIAGASLFLQAAQDIRIGGRQGNSQYQFTLTADALEDLRTWEPKIRAAMVKRKEFTDVDTDLQAGGLAVKLVIDHDTAARLGVTSKAIADALNDTYSQRQIATIYESTNQYKVVFEGPPSLTTGPSTLDHIRVAGQGGRPVPLSRIARTVMATEPVAVEHQDALPSSTISYGLADGYALSDATMALDEVMRDAGVPANIRGTSQGAAQAFQASFKNQPVLILSAIAVIYLVLGMLYESTVHPITILSTLPSAGVGAVLALLVTGTEFSVMALIGVILLIGIVKKNAILMIDFALEAERTRGLAPAEAISLAARLRLRPILMTTMAAALGAVPLAFGTGAGAELRQPLGVTIVGGLLLSQILTLYTTPAVYLTLDRLRHRLLRRSGLEKSNHDAAHPGGDDLAPGAVAHAPA